MSENELRNQELTWHDEQVDPSVERNQAVNLREKTQSITTNQNSSVGRIVNSAYLLFGAVDLLLAVRIVLHLVGANLLQNLALTSTSVPEITTIFVLIVYTIARSGDLAGVAPSPLSRNKALRPLPYRIGVMKIASSERS